MHPKVFISYSHDSDAHTEKIRELAKRLRDGGVVAVIDLYEESPEEGWPKWMERKIEQSDFVLIVCTQTYCERVSGNVPPGTGKGVKWESTLTYQQIYDQDSNNRRFIPVVFGETDSSHIPQALRPYTHYRLYNDYEKLYRRITNQQYPVPPIGGIQKYDADEAPRLGYNKEEAPGSSNANTATLTDSAFFEIYIGRNFDDFAERDQTRILTAIKNLLETNRDLKIIYKKRGSVKLCIELTHAEAERLSWVIQQGGLEYLGVTGSRLLDEEESARERLSRLSETSSIQEGKIVPGVITEIRQNEVVVDIGGKSEGIIPANEFIDIGELQIGGTIEVLIEKIENKEGYAVLSYDKAEQKKNWDNILTKFPEGSVATGRVKAKVKGGLIISIGVDAFIPASHVDIEPPKNLDQYVGQTYDFKVIKIDQLRKNVVLSRRELIEQQRSERRKALLDSIQPGQVRKGVVKNITDFGAFIDLDGVDGLLHITDMSWGRIAHPSEVLKQGEEIQVMIIEVNREKERVSLGLKQTTKNPWDEIEHKFPVGAKVHGKVVNLVPYGAFIEIEPGVEGLVHITEMSWTKRITKPSEMLKVGQEVDAVVLGIQKDDQRISLGLRQLKPNPWDMVRHNYPIGARVRGKVRNMTTYGAFIELEEGIDGMVHVSDMTWNRKVNHPSEVLKKGDEVDAIVLDVDPSQQRISLGMKQLAEDPWSDIDSHFKIGDVVKGTVSKITTFGAFVELKDGSDGLVHISQISDERVEKIRDHLKPGQEVTARVVKIDHEERRLGLSIRAASYGIEQLDAEVSLLKAIEFKDAASTPKMNRSETN